MSELADVDSRLSLERGDGNQHPPLNPCPGIGHSVVTPAPVRTHLLIAVRSSLCLHLSSCPTLTENIIGYRVNHEIGPNIQNKVRNIDIRSTAHFLISSEYVLQWMPKKAVLLNTAEELTVTHGTELSPQTVTLRKLPADRMNDEIGRAHV